MPLWLSTSFINSARLHLNFSFCSIPVGCHSIALIQMIWVLFLALCSKIFFHFKTYFCLKLTFVVVVVQSLSRVWFSVTPWTAACQAIVSFTISWSLWKFMSLESVILSNHPILCHPLFLLSSIFPSVRVFLWVSSSCQVAKGLELQHQSFQWMFRVDFLLDWLVWSSCCLRDSQESSPAPQLESINSSVLFSLLYDPTLTSVLEQQ